jgi:hypothetical protein
MKKIAILLLVATTAGCRTPPMPVPVSYSQRTFPEVGTQVSAGVGDRLITQGEGRTAPVVVLESDQTIGKFLVQKGRYPQSAQNKEYATFRNVAMKRIADGVEQKVDLFLFEKDKDAQVLCVSRASCATVAYVIDKDTTYSSRTTQQTLLYNGKIGNRITLSYREFSDDIARPAFTNEVVYDLGESKVLGYKGARLEVLAASNTELVYKVIAGFDKQ